MKGETLYIVSVVNLPSKMSNLNAPVFVRTMLGSSSAERVWIVSGNTSSCSQVKMLVLLGKGARFVQRVCGAQPYV